MNEWKTLKGTLKRKEKLFAFSLGPKRVHHYKEWNVGYWVSYEKYWKKIITNGKKSILKFFDENVLYMTILMTCHHVW